ncbi:MAG TPA: MarR family transcriptional regulator [Candidatus Paceibacterota bacterium]|nr:MarR family transcriptional regulator [Candidatus Paceibacterota bacterium]
MVERRLQQFKRTVRDFYRKNGRHDLPWRTTRDPYNIMVSEVMLQQTQVSRVIEKYKEFLKRFPTVRALARAPLPRVMSVWSGLGYNRRAKYLKEMARRIVVEHKGAFPKDSKSLTALPGVGLYTARAVAAFAYNVPDVFIETNIRTVFIRHFFPRTTNVSDKHIAALVEQTLDRKNPRIWYWALMDYGAFLKQTKHDRSHRRSAHYKKQPPFDGSVRKARGAILRMLLSGEHSQADLAKKGHLDNASLPRILTTMVKEGLIEKNRNRYKIQEL